MPSSLENRMRKAIVIDKNDIKQILAEKFGVDEKDVIASQYSWTVVLDKDETDDT